jgi:RNA polymerase-binding transcription factor DksA
LDTPNKKTTIRNKAVELPQKIGKKKTKDTEQPQLVLPVKKVAKPIATKKEESVTSPRFIDPDQIPADIKPVRYSDEDLSIFKEVIQIAKSEALEELSMLKERMDDFNNFDFAEESMTYSLHMAEQGTESVEKEKAYSQIQRTIEFIQKLNEALKRIEDKTYGICRKCKCLIARERLLAVPITTLSASYKVHNKCPEDRIDRIERRQ